ncbi:MAG: insulinase family protein [Sandaracinaceae bacterium]
MKALAMKSAALIALGLALSACTLRASLPPPRHPLAATPLEALPDPPREPLEDRPFRMRLVRRELGNGFQTFISRGEQTGVVSVVFVTRATPLWDRRAPQDVTSSMAGLMLRATVGEDGEVIEDLLQSEGFSPDVSVLPGGVRVFDRVLMEDHGRYLVALERTLRHPAYREEDLRRALDARIELLEGHLGGVDGFIDDRMPQLLYAPDDPRGAAMQGRLEVMRGLTTEALRARHAEMLSPAHGALIIAGDVEPLGILPVVGQLFSAWPASELQPELHGPRYPDAAPSRGIAVVEPLLRSYIKVIEQAPPLTDPDHAAFLVLEQMLGAMFASRLNLAFREDARVSYGFHAEYAASGTEGELALATSVDPGASRQVVEEVLRELRRVRGDEEGIQELELSLARTRARETLMASLDTSQGLALSIAQRVMAGLDPGSIGTTLRRIDRLSADDVEAAARRWIRPDRAPLVVVGRGDVVADVMASDQVQLQAFQPPPRRRR